MQAFRFQPRVFERVWGGHALNRIYGRMVPDPDALYGESWEICDRPEASLTVAEGPLEGSDLHTLWTTRRDELFGSGYEQHPRFPLLCKILDARDYLSVQVHPDDKAAETLGAEPKNEIWYIASSDKDSLIFAGLKDKATPTAVKKAVEEERLEELLQKYHLQQGDCFYIPAGMVHAIGPGNIIFEIQQNSDTTYRLYDWGRKGRELHVKQALTCIKDRPPESSPRFAALGEIAATPWFVIEEVRVPAGETVPLPDPERFSIVIVIEGRLELPTGFCREGDFVLVPANATAVHSVGDARVLVIHCPPDKA